jgi:hypothetical protein
MSWERRLAAEQEAFGPASERHVLAAFGRHRRRPSGLGKLLDPGPLIQPATAVTHGSIAPPHVHDHRRSDGTST